MDPLAGKYPYQSPYLFAGNNPIRFIDHKGQFQLDANTAKKYKNVAAYINTQMSKDIMSNTAAIKSFKSINPNLTDQNIRNIYSEGKGPVLMSERYPNRQDAVGFTEYSVGTSIISINEKVFEYVESVLSNSKATEREKGVAIMHLNVTIGHEVSGHEIGGYMGVDANGRDIKEGKLINNSGWSDAGYKWEYDVFGIEPGMNDERRGRPDGQGEGFHYDFGARRYDPIYGRFWSVDPLADDYASVSPYVFVLNNPINAIDPDGKRVYFVAGAGNDVSGWNYVNRFAKIWTPKGIAGFTRVNASGGAAKDIAFTSSYRSFSNIGRGLDGQIKRRDHKQIERAVNGIMADLIKRPLKEGEQLNLAGYSYGSVLQANVALQLADKGVKINNLILIGSPISDKSELYNALKTNENIGKVIRHDIEGDYLSNPQSERDFIKGGVQNRDLKNKGEGPHFDLARPGAEADRKIGELGDKLKSEGVK